MLSNNERGWGFADMKKDKLFPKNYRILSKNVALDAKNCKFNLFLGTFVYIIKKNREEIAHCVQKLGRSCGASGDNSTCGRCRQTAFFMTVYRIQHG